MGNSIIKYLNCKWWHPCEKCIGECDNEEDSCLAYQSWLKARNDAEKLIAFVEETAGDGALVPTARAMAALRLLEEIDK